MAKPIIFILLLLLLFFLLLTVIRPGGGGGGGPPLHVSHDNFAEIIFARNRAFATFSFESCATFDAINRKNWAYHSEVTQCYVIKRRLKNSHDTCTKIIKFGWVVLILCPFLEIRSFSNFAQFLRPMSEELCRE